MAMKCVGHRAPSQVTKMKKKFDFISFFCLLFSFLYVVFMIHELVGEFGEYRRFYSLFNGTISALAAISWYFAFTYQEAQKSQKVVLIIMLGIGSTVLTECGDDSKTPDGPLSNAS
jgi:hypothetical protein